MQASPTPEPDTPRPGRARRGPIGLVRPEGRPEDVQAPEDALTPTLLREAFGLFPSGVIAICAVVDGRPEGLAASSFVPVSLDPALVSVCFAHTSKTWPKLRTAPRLGISVLSEGHATLARQLSGSAGNRFADVPWTTTPDDAVLIEGSALWLECSIAQEVRAGDHDIVVLRVHLAQPHPEVQPVVFHSSNLGGFGHHSRGASTFRDELPPHNRLNDSLFSATAEHAWG